MNARQRRKARRARQRKLEAAMRSSGDAFTRFGIAARRAELTLRELQRRLEILRSGSLFEQMSIMPFDPAARIKIKKGNAIGRSARAAAALASFDPRSLMVISKPKRHDWLRSLLDVSGPDLVVGFDDDGWAYAVPQEELNREEGEE